MLLPDLLHVNTHPSVIAIEGCSRSHYWGRYAEQFGHEVHIISSKKVKGYLEGHKTDKNDALAIANAAIQISIKFSQPKSIEQQPLHSLETSRQLFNSQHSFIGQSYSSLVAK